MKGKFVGMYIEYLLPVVRMLFKSPVSCILRSVSELCTTPDQRIKPQLDVNAKQSFSDVPNRFNELCSSLAFVRNKFTEFCSLTATVPNKFTELCSSAATDLFTF